jgi:hypothetical protein
MAAPPEGGLDVPLPNLLGEALGDPGTPLRACLCEHDGSEVLGIGSAIPKKESWS